MPQTAELVGKVGRLQLPQPANEHGLTLTAKVLSGGSTKGPPQRCTACALTPDGETLGLATDSGAVYALHLNKQRYALLDTLASPGTAAVFMARLSRRLFVGCRSGEIHCFDISSSSARLAKLPGHRAAVASLSTKSDTEQLLSASADAVLVWDMQTFRQRRMLSGAPYGSSVAAFSPPGNLTAAAAASGDLVVWSTRELREVAGCRRLVACSSAASLPAASASALMSAGYWSAAARLRCCCCTAYSMRAWCMRCCCRMGCLA
ncbi:WD40-repeat-containing domain protein [Scenedesmus sp. NREL 46B-D3]|nr:WD40-repeat-containing domain protein [Scenedesmus sp. NREL 46B-D3]